MGRGANAGGRIAVLIGVCLKKRDQVRHAVRLDLWADEQDVRNRREQRNGREVGLRIIVACFALNGLMTCVAIVPIRSTVPSGAPRATRAAPSMPPAPLTFSTTTGTDNRSLSLLATIRLTTSVAPPAANGTTRVIGRFGRADWLWAATLPTTLATAEAAHLRKVLLPNPTCCMVPSQRSQSPAVRNSRSGCGCFLEQI